MAPPRSSATRRSSSSGPLRVVSAALALVAGLAPGLAAQRFWRENFYPYAYYSTIDGLWGALHYGRYSPIGFVERPEPNHAALNLDAGASTQGSRALVLDAQAPAWWDGWRAGLTLTAARDNRLGYYGVGNDTRYAPDSVTRAGQYFYEVSRTRLVARATLQRRVVGRLRALVGGTLGQSDFRALPGPSVFARDVAAGALGTGATAFTDHVVRAGLVLDTRDNEADPHAGLFVEALLARGSGYTRRTTHARLYVHALARLVLAGRLAAEGMGGTPPLAAEQEMESSEGPFVALGGYHSLRGFYDGRFTGPGKLIGGLEARYALVWVPSVLELKLVGFYDAGRAFGPGEDVRLTSAGLHHSGGAALALRLLGNSLLVVGYGRGPEGGELLFATSWSY